MPVSSQGQQSSQARPFFSILVCSYNRPQYLKQCINSILANHFTSYEIIVSDDCSSNIKEIRHQVQEYLSNPKVTFVEQDKNLGWSGNRNFLLGKSYGEYVLIIGDDDKLYPHTMQRLFENIKQHPDYDMFAFGYRVIDEQSDYIYERKAPRKFDISLQDMRMVRQLYLSNLFPFWLFHPFSICYKREVADNFSYNQQAHIGDDYLFLFDCVNKNRKIKVLPEILFQWRKIQKENKKVFSNISYSPDNNIIARLNIYNLLQKRTDLLPEIKRIVNSYEFKSTFLLQPVLTQKNLSLKALENLGFGQDDLREIRQYREKSNKLGFLRFPINRLLAYYRLFGPAAFGAFIKYGLDKALYRTKAYRH